VEAIGLMAQARTVAIMRYSNGQFSGSGTDSLALASPLEGPKLRWAGMHTTVGEVVGKASLQAVEKALKAWPGLG